jgi:hypothetical protein
MTLPDATSAGEADRCEECGAAHRPMGSSGGGKSPSYTVCPHTWHCSERKPSWSDYQHRSLP